MLVRANDTTPIVGQLIKFDVDGMPYTGTTDPDGYVTQPLNLVAVGGQTTTYQINALFEGAGFKTRNLTITDPYGNDYLVCTTNQWDFKSSQNTVTLTVEAPKTDTTASTSDENVTVTQNDESTTATIPPPKTQEEMQQEAVQSGELRVESRFSLGYPWYRLHYISTYDGQDVLDIGLAPIGFDVAIPSSRFNSWINDFLRTIANAVVIGYVSSEIAVLAAMWYGPQAFAITLLASTVVKLGLLCANWDSVQGLRSAFIGGWVSLILGTVGTIRMLHSGIISLAFGFIEAASKVDYWKFIYKFICIPINVALLLMTLNRLNELGGI
jgi:hypothetical protein